MTYIEGEAPIVLVETAYAWTFEDQDGYPNIVGPWYSPPPEYPVTPAGQALFIRDLRWRRLDRR